MLPLAHQGFLALPKENFLFTNAIHKHETDLLLLTSHLLLKILLGGLDPGLVSLITSQDGFTATIGPKLLGTVGSVMEGMGGLEEVSEAGIHDHTTKVDKVAMVLIVHGDYAPSVSPSPGHASPLYLDNLIATDNSEGEVGFEILVIIPFIRDTRGVKGNLMVLEVTEDVPLKVILLLRSQGIGLGNDGNYINLTGQGTQGKNVKFFQRVTRGGDKVKESVDTGIWDCLAVFRGPLCLEIGVELGVDVLNNGLEVFLSVKLITKSWGVNDGKLKGDSILNELVVLGLNVDGLGVLRVLWTNFLCEIRIEEGVKEGGLTQTSLT